MEFAICWRHTELTIRWWMGFRFRNQSWRAETWHGSWCNRGRAAMTYFSDKKTLRSQKRYSNDVIKQLRSSETIQLQSETLVIFPPTLRQKDLSRVRTVQPFTFVQLKFEHVIWRFFERAYPRYYTSRYPFHINIYIWFDVLFGFSEVLF